jgi:nitronate monooxygenase
LTRRSAIGCQEATVSVPYRDALRQATEDDTRLTRVFTGQPARTLRNRLTDEMKDAEVIDFPAQLSLTHPLAKACSHGNRTDFVPLWAGQAVPMVRSLPAAAPIDTLVAESRLWLPHDSRRTDRVSPGWITDA